MISRSGLSGGPWLSPRSFGPTGRSALFLLILHLSSRGGKPEVITGHCPTCHQELADSLLDTANKATPMTVDQNVSFYEEEIQLFTAVHANAMNNIETAEKDLRAHRAEVTRLRERIRDIRE